MEMAHVTTAAARWPHARNVLCVRLDAIGDVLMTTPAMRALEHSLDSPRITLLTSRAGAAVAPLIPEIDDVITYEAPWMKAPPDAETIAQAADRLRAREFDAAVIFTVSTQRALPAGLLCYAAGIPLRLAHARENPYSLLTDWVRDPADDAGRHEVRRQLDLVATVGCASEDERLSLRVPPEASTRARAVLADAGVSDGAPWVVVHPGATAQSRRYAPESFAAACDMLAAGDGWRIVFTGSASESELVASVRARMFADSASLAGMMDVAELAAVIEAAPLLISNNSGPVHIAAAVGTPVVDLYALTNPQHTPWLVPSRVLSHDVPCRWCRRSICPEGHHNCLRLVEPAEVAEAARELARETSGRRERAAAATRA
jgi:lipopolysaccharide heptosyltransferase II